MCSLIHNNLKLEPTQKSFNTRTFKQTWDSHTMEHCVATGTTDWTGAQDNLYGSQGNYTE